ncbi:MAG: amidohydrolase family protein [Ruminococcus sp.]|nr:amidohydrolase family protein [Ruminococcus sp.]
MIIDFHTHAFNPKIAQRAMETLTQKSGLEPYTDGTLNSLVNRMDEWGVNVSVMLSIATKPTQQTVINDWAAQVDKSNERIIAFGSVHPNAADCLDEVLRIKRLGLHGIKLHPDFQGFMADDPSLDELYDLLEQIGLPLILHSGFDFSSPNLLHCTPFRAANLIKKHPKLKAIFAHLGANYCWEEVLELLAGADGEVYFDTAYTLDCPDELMAEIIRRHGADRILLGSDCPWESTQKIIEKLLRLDLTDDELEKILGKNAEQLLF